MLGLIKKDLYLILNNRNAIIIYLIMVGFFAVFAKMDISYILPFFFLSIFLSTFSYDEYNNFNGYFKSFVWLLLCACAILIGTLCSFAYFKGTPAIQSK